MDAQLAGIIVRANNNHELNGVHSATLQRQTDDMMTYILTSLTGVAALLAIPLTIAEQGLTDPQAVRAVRQQLVKRWNALRERGKRDLVYVHPQDVKGTSMLRLELPRASQAEI